MSRTRKVLILLCVATLIWVMVSLGQPADSGQAPPATTTTTALTPQEDDRTWHHQSQEAQARQRLEDRRVWFAAAAAAEQKAALEALYAADQEAKARAARKAAEARRRESSAVAATPGSNYQRFLRLADCETGDRYQDDAGNLHFVPGTARWDANTGNGYYGGLQFSADTWRRAGGTGLPHQHSADTQIAIAESWLARTSWAQWPDCSRRLGYR